MDLFRPSLVHQEHCLLQARTFPSIFFSAQGTVHQPSLHGTRVRSPSAWAVATATTTIWVSVIPPALSALKARAISTVKSPRRSLRAPNIVLSVVMVEAIKDKGATTVVHLMDYEASLRTAQLLLILLAGAILADTTREITGLSSSAATDLPQSTPSAMDDMANTRLRALMCHTVDHVCRRTTIQPVLVSVTAVGLCRICIGMNHTTASTSAVGDIAAGMLLPSNRLTTETMYPSRLMASQAKSKSRMVLAFPVCGLFYFHVYSRFFGPNTNVPFFRPQKKSFCCAIAHLQFVVIECPRKKLAAAR